MVSISFKFEKHQTGRHGLDSLRHKNFPAQWLHWSMELCCWELSVLFLGISGFQFFTFIKTFVELWWVMTPIDCSYHHYTAFTLIIILFLASSLFSLGSLPTMKKKPIGQVGHCVGGSHEQMKRRTLERFPNRTSFGLSWSITWSAICLENLQNDLFLLRVA